MSAPHSICQGKLNLGVISLLLAKEEHKICWYWVTSCSRTWLVNPFVREEDFFLIILGCNLLKHWRMELNYMYGLMWSRLLIIVLYSDLSLSR